jgi:predicted amidohydrolase
MKIAALQMVSAVEWSSNQAQAQSLLEQAAAQHVELAVLPEYFCIMGRKDTDKLALQERFGDGPIQSFLSDTAKRLGIWIVGGTLPLSTNDPLKVTNSSLVFNPQGKCVTRYDKIHLFRFTQGEESYDESRVLVPGRNPVAFDLPSRDGSTYRVGLSICYDLRFPELFRQLNSHLLLVPSAFTYTTGQAHWELLLRARATENLCYVLASAQGGLHENGRTTWGHSMVVGPWGDVMSLQSTGPGVVISDIDHTAINECRTKLPALDHRSL